MDYSEKWGKSVDIAVELALKDLKVGIDEVDVEVLEEPSKGFLGLGSKLAKVRVTKKSAVQEKPEEAPKAPEKKKPDYGVIDLRSKEAKGEAPAKPVQDRPREKRNDGRKRSRSKNRENREFKELTLPETPDTVISNRPDDLIPVMEHAALDFLRETT